MDFEKIKELIKMVDSSSLAFFELQSCNDHIKMDKSLIRSVDDTVNTVKTGIVNKVVEAAVAPVVTKEKVENYVGEDEKLKIVEEENIIDKKSLRIITSPMVGTFYSSASPESNSFAKVGDTIAKGKIICIIEAMKLMNEIESEYSGVIVECLVKDGDMVEYGQPLFKVKGE